MTSITLEKLMREQPLTEDRKLYISQLASQHNYIVDFNKLIAYAETRCGWRESMQKDREAINRYKRRMGLY